MFLLVSLAGSYSITRQISQKERFSFLPSFGFSRGGRFLIRVFAANRTGVRVYLLPGKFDNAFSRNSIDIGQICNYSFTIPGAMSFDSGMQTDTWEGEVNHSDLIIPFVTNCLFTRIAVSIKFSNPNSMLDAREALLPTLYLLLVLIYCCISFAFVINQLRHRHLLVGIHASFALCSVLKGLHCYFSADLWNTKSLTDDLPTRSVLCVEICFVLANTGLFAFNALAILGSGTFREKIRSDELIAVFLMSLWFFVCLSAMHVTSQSGYLTALFFLNLIDLYLYGRFVYEGLVAAVKLQMMLWSNEPLRLKIEMVIIFGGYVTVWMVLLSFIATFIVIMPSWTLRKKLIEEAFILALFAIDIAVFFYRREHEPAQDQNSDMGVNEEGDLDDSKMVYLMEPDDPFFAYLNRPQFVGGA
jgi:hypothetical protein